MKKFADNSPITPQNPSPDYESSSLLNTHYIKQDAQRRRNYVYLTLFNLFIFTLSMLSLICAVMSQKDSSGYSAAKLMDDFGIACTYCKPRRRKQELTVYPQHQQNTSSSTSTSNSNFPTHSTRQSTWVSRTTWKMRGWMLRIVRIPLPLPPISSLTPPQYLTK
jgi:hypothetical protein